MDINPDLISILMPNYNKAPYLKEAIDSVIRQTALNWELIICDNGSGDGSDMVIRQYRENPKIKALWYPQQLGSALALNKCFDASSGSFIKRLDSDDRMKPECLDKLLGGFAKVDGVYGDPEVDGVYGDIDEVDYQGRFKKCCKVPMDAQSQIFDRCVISNQGLMVRREAFLAVGGFDEKVAFSEDWEFILSLIKAGKNLIHVNESVADWRIVFDAKHVQSKTNVYHSGSMIRKLDHAYIRYKHYLKGPCLCGCGAVATDYENRT
jgi:glycosyltransferase involved in cell wall biosynthesis